MTEVQVALTHDYVDVVPRKLIKLGDRSVSWDITDKCQFDSVAIHWPDGTTFQQFDKVYDANPSDTVVVGVNWKI